MGSGVTPQKLREAIAETMADCVKSYDVADACVALGLAPARDESDDPFRSKRVYVRSRLIGKPISELVDLAHRVAAEYDDKHLRPLLDQLGAHGVQGELKNLIFAADGPKPRIVLRDAVNNVIEIVEHAEHCLVYDRPLTERGLTWRELVGWWADQRPNAPEDERERARELYDRLVRSLANDVEKKLFRTYCALYAEPGGFDLPALVPQVYLHYDPYTKRQLGNRSGQLKRQRMDFLMLLPQRSRVVLEVDGQQHYATADGAADPVRYAEMAAEDRSLRLAGYEVYRFGAHELTADRAVDGLRTFFRELLTAHHVLPA